MMTRILCMMAFTMMAVACTDDTANHQSSATKPESRTSSIADRWQPGKHFESISPAQPTHAAAGEIEVIEFFWYACPHCYALEPRLIPWKKKRPSFISFRQIPAPIGEISRAHARLFYTLETLGRDDLHAVVFDAIQRLDNRLAVRGNVPETLRLQLSLAQKYGIPESEFLRAYNSDQVQTRMAEADQLVRTYAISSVPSVIINGKYKSAVSMAGGESQLVALTIELAMLERGTGSGVKTTASLQKAQSH